MRRRWLGVRVSPRSAVVEQAATRLRVQRRHRPHAKAYRLHHSCRTGPEAGAPGGPQWIHEVKFDGWRMQFHEAGDRVVVSSRNGIDMTSRFAMIRDKVLSLPAASAIR
jgi:bifunctional non-homologous end joining protein LigD